MPKVETKPCCTYCWDWGRSRARDGRRSLRGSKGWPGLIMIRDAGSERRGWNGAQEERRGRWGADAAFPFRLHRTGMRTESNSIIVARIVVPKITDAGRGVTCNEEESTLPEIGFIILELDGEVETVPSISRCSADEVAHCLAVVGIG